MQHIEQHFSGSATVRDIVIGFVKRHFTGVPRTRSALQTAMVGSLAAGVAYAIAKLIA